jgi:serine/threonine-protein kinase RsbW
MCWVICSKMSPSNATGTGTLIIGNAIAELQKVVDFVENFGAAHDIPKGATNDLNLCLDEILNNTISYGYENQSSKHSIAVTLSLANGWLIAEIQDDGKPFDPREPGLPITGTMQSRRVGGLGRSFVKALMDEVDYERKRRYNVLTIRKKIAHE